MATKALIVGIGGTGVKVLTHLKASLINKGKSGRLPDTIKLLAMDTVSPGQIEPYPVQGVELDCRGPAHTEYFHLENTDPTVRGMADNLSYHTHYTKWFRAARFEKVPPANYNIADGAGQHRQFARAGLFLNSRAILSTLKNKLSSIQSAQPDDSSVYCWVIASASGGTGAGAFVDVGAMIRHALEQTSELTRGPSGKAVPGYVSGKLILTNAYSYVHGVSKGRAFSLVRDIAWFQYPYATRDFLYQRPRMDDLKGPQPYCNLFDYPSGLYRRNEKLFEAVEFLDRHCATKDQTNDLLKEVASTLELLVNDDSGPTLQQRINNDSGAAAQLEIDVAIPTCGFSRVYLPVSWYAKIFSLEEIIAFTRSLARPKNGTGALHTSQERGDSEAKATVSELFPNLAALRDLDLEDRKAVAGFQAQYLLRSADIVNKLYGLGASDSLGLAPGDRTMAAAKRLYARVYEADDDISVDGEKPEARVKTHRERADAREKRSDNPEVEKRQFSKALANRRQAYYGTMEGVGPNQPGAGDDNSFNGALLSFRRAASVHLCRQLDRKIIASLAESLNIGESGRIGLSQQFLEELDSQLSRRIDELERVSAHLPDELTRAKKQASEAGAEFEDAKVGSKLLFLKDLSDIVDAEESYRAAEEAKGECYRRQWLVKGLVGVIEDIRARIVDWQKEVNRIADQLVSPVQGSKGVLRAKQDELKEAKQHLQEAARSTTDAIGVLGDSDSSGQMGGYMEVLRTKCAADPHGDNRPYHQSWLAGAQWVGSVDDDGQPRIRLKGKNFPAQSDIDSEQPHDVDAVMQHIEKWLRERVHKQLQNTSIWDYIEWQSGQPGGQSWEEIGTFLRKRTDLLLHGEPQSANHTPSYVLVYDDKGLSTEHRTDLAKGIRRAAGQLDALDPKQLQQVERFGDKHTLILFAHMIYDWQKVTAIDDLQGQYIEDQFLRDDDKNWTPYTYHPFRGTQEAFDLERRLAHDRHAFLSADDLIDPLLLRALDQPLMTWLFIRAKVLGLVWQNNQDDDHWYIGEADQDFRLTGTQGQTEDLLTALARVCLQHTMHKKGNNRELTAETLEQWVKTAANKPGVDFAALTERFLADLDSAVDRELAKRPERVKASFKAICRYYVGRRKADVE
ncbi:MAG: hypothetical protein MJE77_08940 [Proteobacteria bacterium]|nr:hypothetical protein [Pseudomonadota bacterium]